MTEQDDQQEKPGDGQVQAGDELGLAGRVAQAFINSPLSPLLFMSMLLMGVMGLIYTPRQEDPQISVPMVDVMVQYPGASAAQVASLAIEPLERMMSEIPGVDHIYSASQRGQGIATVQFDVGEDLGPSVVKVHDKLQSNMDKIPPGVSRPLVKSVGIDDVPVVTLTLWSEDVDDAALRILALDVLQNLKEIPNTGQGFVVGGRADQVRVEVFPERLSGYGISLDQVAETIRTANAEQAVGGVESGGAHFTVVTGSFLRTVRDIKRLVVGTHHGVPIYVRDVARVTQEPEETRQLVSYYTGAANEQEPPGQGVPAVTIAVAKKVGTNGVEVANAILDRVEKLKGHMIPANVQMSVTRNYGKTANDKVNSLIFKLFVATGWVFLLVLLAFFSLRPALVVLMIIPVVILFTVFAAWLMGYTVDRVSLFALIFSIGILVDDAIVVVENIYRRWLLKGETDTETAVDAVREVGNPTILATFTVIAALLPMGFVSGMMGPYMEPIPALGSVAMLVSLLAAFVFTPWLAMRLKPKFSYLQKAEKREHREAEWLEKVFRWVLDPLIDRKSMRLLFRLGLWGAFGLACSMFYTTAVAVKMLPLDNKPEFSVVIDMPEGTAVPVTANFANRIARVVRKLPEVIAVQTYAGNARPFDFNGMVRHYYLRQEPWQGEVQVQLLDKEDRERSSHEIAVEARELLTPLAERIGARIAVVEMPPGPPVLQSVVAEIHGSNDRVRRQVAADMTEFFRKAENITDVDNYMAEPYDYWRFEVDREKAVRRGISVDTINRSVAMAMGGFSLGDVKQGTVLEPTHIIIQVPLYARSQVTRLNDLPIQSGSGRTVPLGELGRFSRVPEDPILYHKDLREVEYVVGDVTGRLAAPIYGMFQVEDQLIDYKAPDGVKLESYYIGPPPDDKVSAFEWSGEWTVTYETFRDMGIAFAVALILIYILVVWEFGNFRIPALIMAPIPLTLLGIIPGHWLFGAEFTATSMIGWIALAGIIVRNSILLVDFSVHEVRRGASVRDAVISSCKTRTRPIMITALALVAGSSVIFTDPIFQGMAISLAFGVLVSTILTLVVIPLGCIQASKALCQIVEQGSSAKCDEADLAVKGARAKTAPSFGARIWAILVSPFMMVFYLIRALFILLWQGLQALFRLVLFFKKPQPKPQGPPGGGSATPPPSGTPPAPAPTQPPPDSAAPSAAQTVSGAGTAAASEEKSPVLATSSRVREPVSSPEEASQRPSERVETGTVPEVPLTAEASIGSIPSEDRVEGIPVRPAAAPENHEVEQPAKTAAREPLSNRTTSKSAKAKKAASSARASKGARRGIRLKGDGSDESADPKSS